VKDAARAEQILKDGLASPGVEDRADILERLALLYEKTGRGEEAGTVREEIKRLQSPNRRMARHSPASLQIKQTFDFGEQGLPPAQLPNLAKSLKSARLAPGDSVDKPSKVGRNEPCPCGSGKKYKKCCGKRGVSGSNL
jgi:preprotein translocase subunit SecA